MPAHTLAFATPREPVCQFLQVRSVYLSSLCWGSVFFWRACTEACHSLSSEGTQGHAVPCGGWRPLPMANPRWPRPPGAPSPGPRPGPWRRASAPGGVVLRPADACSPFWPARNAGRPAQRRPSALPACDAPPPHASHVAGALSSLQPPRSSAAAGHSRDSTGWSHSCCRAEDPPASDSP